MYIILFCQWTKNLFIINQSIKVRGGKRLTRYRLHCGAAAADVGLRRTLLQALVRRGDQLPGVDLGRISAGIHCRQHA